MSSTDSPPPLSKPCRIAAAPPCAWSAHRYKHFPFGGMTKAHTRHPNPARYLEAGRIREIELTTARMPDATTRDGMSAAYLRDSGAVIGWDDGSDATLSYVECSGGETAGRSFHGRPMSATNHVALRMRVEVER